MQIMHVPRLQHKTYITISAYVLVIFVICVILPQFAHYREGESYSLLEVICGMAATGALAYFWVKNICKKNEQEERDIRGPLGVTGIFSITLAVIALVIFFKTIGTAYEWPALDMAPYFLRSNNPMFLLNDFFTNASMLGNPRMIFGWIVTSLNTLTQSGWYPILFFLRILVTTTTLPLFFLIIAQTLRERITDAHRLRFALVLAFVLCLLPVFYITNVLTHIGTWFPYSPESTPQGIATVFCLAGIYVVKTQVAHRRLLTGTLFFIATLIHTPIALFFYIFHIIVRSPRTPIKQLLLEIIPSIILPALVIAKIFAPNHSLDAAAFVQIYAYNNHAHHYIPSVFLNSNRIIVLLGICSIFFTTIKLGITRKNKWVTLLGTFSAISYLGALIAQYFFVEVYPVKLVAAIGPVRFTFLGYWLVALCLSAGLALLTPNEALPHWALSKNAIKQIIATFSIACISLLFYGVLNIDHPEKEIKTAYGNFGSWIIGSNPNSTYITPPNMSSWDLPIIFHRAVFTGNGFPFSEDAFLEYDTRRQMVYGGYGELTKMPSLNLSDKYNDFYRARTPADFVRAAQLFPADYVIIESGYINNFVGIKPEYKDNKYTVFSIMSLAASLTHDTL